MIVIFAGLYFPLLNSYADTQTTAILAALCVSATIIVSVFFHELAHVFTAKSFGVQAEEIGLTLLGGHASFSQQFTRPWHGTVTALAGPTANLAIAALLYGAYQTLEAPSLTLSVLHISATMNLFLALFNLLPGLPLDGGNAVSTLIWNYTGRQSTGLRVAARIGQGISISWFVWAVILPLIQGKQLNTVILVWTIMIVIVLWGGAHASLKRAQYLNEMEKLTLGHLITPAHVVRSTHTITDLYTALRDNAPTTAIVVSETGHPLGYVDFNAVSTVNEDMRAHTPIASVTIPLLPGSVVPATATPAQLVQALRHGRDIRNIFVVVDAADVVGVIWTVSLLNAVHPDQ